MFFLLNDTITVNENSPPHIHLKSTNFSKKKYFGCDLNECVQ